MRMMTKPLADRMRKSKLTIYPHLWVRSLFNTYLQKISSSTNRIGAFEPLQVIWVCSYPRSGSTWVRSIIAELLRSDRVSLIPPIEKVHSEGVTVKIKDTPTIFVKTHAIEFPYYVFPLSRALSLRTIGFINIYRHPLDVMLSSLNYLQLRNMRSFLFDPECDPLSDGNRDELRKYVEAFTRDFSIGNNAFLRMCGGNWDDHVTAYFIRNQQADYQSAIIKYEDLIRDTSSALAPLKSLLDVSGDEIERAVMATNKKLERDGQFYWKMKSRNYHEYLSEGELRDFYNKHWKILELAGYASDR